MVNKEYFGESKNIEFKREIPSKHEKFLKDIIAFSNSTGGQVVLGVEDGTGALTSSKSSTQPTYFALLGLYFLFAFGSDTFLFGAAFKNSNTSS